MAIVSGLSSRVFWGLLAGCVINQGPFCARCDPDSLVRSCVPSGSEGCYPKYGPVFNVTMALYTSHRAQNQSFM